MLAVGGASVRLCMQLSAGAGCLAFSVLTYIVVICSLVGAAALPARDVIVFSVLSCCGLAGVSCARAGWGGCAAGTGC